MIENEIKCTYMFNTYTPMTLSADLSFYIRFLLDVVPLVGALTLERARCGIYVINQIKKKEKGRR